MLPWVAGIAVISAIIVGLIYLDELDSRQCEAAGGHRISKTTVGVAVTGKGVGPAVGSVDFCISSDGRILY